VVLANVVQFENALRRMGKPREIEKREITLWGPRKGCPREREMRTKASTGGFGDWERPL